MSLPTQEALSIQVHAMTKGKAPGNDKKQIGDTWLATFWNSGHVEQWEMTHRIKEGDGVNLL